MTKFKYKVSTLIILLICGITFMDCESKIENTEKYCGVELSNIQIKEIESQVGSYEYSDNDLDVLAEITSDVHELFNDTLVIELFFFLKEKDKIGIYIIAPNDNKVVEKISCHLLNDQLEYKMPKDRFLIIYSNESENLITGIRNKKQK